MTSISWQLQSVGNPSSPWCKLKSHKTASVLWLHTARALQAALTALKKKEQSCYCKTDFTWWGPKILVNSSSYGLYFLKWLLQTYAWIRNIDFVLLHFASTIFVFHSIHFVYNLYNFMNNFLMCRHVRTCRGHRLTSAVFLYGLFIETQSLSGPGILHFSWNVWDWALWSSCFLSTALELQTHSHTNFLWVSVIWTQVLRPLTPFAHQAAAVSLPCLVNFLLNRNFIFTCILFIKVSSFYEQDLLSITKYLEIFHNWKSVSINVIAIKVYMK